MLLQSDEFEVLIIGGGAAGLAAAMSLGRMGRKVLLCDEGHPRNQPAVHMHNFPGFDGVSPRVWQQRVQTELKNYASIQPVADRVQALESHEQGFEAHLLSGQRIRSQKVLLAYGIRDQLPEIENLWPLWGKSVFHCPFCHGFEVQNQALGLIGSGQHAQHILPVLLSLSSDFVLFSHGPTELTQAEMAALEARQIRIVETAVKALSSEGTQLTGVVLENGEHISRQGLFVSPLMPLQPSSELGSLLGCKRTEMGLYQVDTFGRTSVPGVYAAGDIAAGAQSVINAAASGSLAGAALVFELLGPLAQV